MGGLSKLYYKIPDRLWVATMAVFSGLLQLSFISKSSIWHDEGYSVLLAPQSIADILTRTARDVHPPLYYLKLHFWMELFGNSELVVRSFSTLCIVLTIIIMFGVTKRLFGSGPARLTVLLMAVAPFLIRYGQEARMYALAALLVTLATYLLVTALDMPSRSRLYLYGLVLAAAFYTHYYVALIVPVHWLYVLLRSRTRAHRPKDSLGITSIHWWLANALALGLFAPWLPVVYAQFTRVQGAFWIWPVDEFTLPGTLGQFIHFTNLGHIWPWWRVIIAIGFMLLVVATLLLNKVQRKSLVLLTSWLLVPPLTIFGLSMVARPIYVERYFVFASMAFYGLLATMLYLKPLNYLPKLRPWLVIGLLVLFGFGVRQVYLQADHQMRSVAAQVNQNYKSGDLIISGELYTYLDFSHYNQTGQTAQLYRPEITVGYGETSLFYERADEVVVNSFEQLDPVSGYVWIIGKSGDKQYFKEVPANWKLDKHIEVRESVANRYVVETDGGTN